MSPLFLNMPAELRIKIYKLLVASSPSDPIKIHHVKENQSRGFAVLAGVNRQLRAEYLDELQHTSISLPYSNIPSLTPLLTSSSPIPSTLSTLHISLLRSPSTSTYIDLLPLLTLHHCTRLTPTLTSQSLLTDGYHPSEFYWSQYINDFLAHKDPEWVALVKDKESVLAGVLLRIECETRISHLKLVFKEEHERGDPDWEATDKLYLRMLGMKGTPEERSGRRWSWWKVTIETWGMEKRREGRLGR